MMSVGLSSGLNIFLPSLLRADFSCLAASAGFIVPTFFQQSHNCFRYTLIFSENRVDFLSFFKAFTQSCNNLMS